MPSCNYETLKVKTNDKEHQLSRTTRQNTLKVVYQLIRERNVDELDHVSSYYRRNLCYKENSKPFDAKDLDRLHKTVRRILREGGNNAKVPIYILSLLFEGRNGNQCKKAISIQLPLLSGPRNQKYDKIWNVMEKIFAEYIESEKRDGRLTADNADEENRQNGMLQRFENTINIISNHLHLQPKKGILKKKHVLETVSKKTPSLSVSKANKAYEEKIKADKSWRGEIKVLCTDFTTSIDAMISDFPLKDVCTLECSVEQNIMKQLQLLFRSQREREMFALTSPSSSYSFNILRNTLIERQAFLKCDTLMDRILYIIPVTEDICSAIFTVNLFHRNKETQWIVILTLN